MTLTRPLARTTPILSHDNADSMRDALRRLFSALDFALLWRPENVAGGESYDVFRFLDWVGLHTIGDGATKVVGIEAHRTLDGTTARVVLPSVARVAEPLTADARRALFRASQRDAEADDADAPTVAAAEQLDAEQLDDARGAA